MTSTLRCERCDGRFRRDGFRVVIPSAALGPRLVRVLLHTACGAYVAVLLSEGDTIAATS